MPKGKHDGKSKIPANLTHLPLDLHPALFKFCSIIELSQKARTHSIFNKFYLFKCAQSVLNGDDVAASQIFAQLKKFATFLDEKFRKKSNELEINTKFKLLFAKLKLAYTMAKDNQLKSEIANYYFLRLKGVAHYTIADNDEINVFCNHLMEQLPTIDVGTNARLTPSEKRLLLLSSLETLRQKSRNIIGTTLVTSQIRDLIVIFRKESLPFIKEYEQENYEAKLKEHEEKLTQETDHSQTLMPISAPSGKTEGLITSLLRKLSSKGS